MSDFITRKYGCKIDKYDSRDRMFASYIDPTSLPNEAGVIQWAPPHMDQGRLGACTGHGISGAYRTERIKNGMPDRSFSRLQLYFNERLLEGTVDQDAGAEIRDGIKVISSTGIAPEELWEYDITKFNIAPPKEVYDAAALDVALTYSRVNVTVNDVKAAIVSGHPVIIGISIFESFESAEVARTGIVPMPGEHENCLGGHCMYIIGYGQKPGYFTVRNSWGDNWGDHGDCYIPEEYIGNPDLGADYWVIDSVKSI